MTVSDSEPDLEAIRHQLLALFSRKYGWEITRPHRWRPLTVKDPSSGEYFTEAGARAFVVQLLELEHPIEVTRMHTAPGRTGYVMKVRGWTGEPDIYIKLQLGSGKIICRSFHPSDFPPDPDQGE